VVPFAGSFAWINHRLMRHGYVAVMTHPEQSLYLFLILVGDRNGVSFYRQEKICDLLGLDAHRVQMCKGGVAGRFILGTANPEGQRNLALPACSDRARILPSRSRWIMGRPHMQVRTLGRTGIQVSIFGFGCMRLPTTGTPDQIDEPAATKLLHDAIDAGVNYLDTAWYYHPKVFGQRGFSESFLGRALSGARRDKIYLATKMPQSWVKSRADMDCFLEDQLQHLKTDHVDFYLLHGIDGNAWDRLRDLGVREFLDSARQRGLIRFPAFSFHGDRDDFPRIIDGYDQWALAQIQYNYVDTQWQAGLSGLRYAADKGLGVVVMEPLKGGHLADLAPPVLRLLFSYRNEGWTPAEWALRFVWNEPGVSLLLSGMSNAAQLAENLRIANSAHANGLSTEQLNVCEAARDALWATIKADCTNCGYCQPCPHGVQIPKILDAYYAAALWSTTNDWITGYGLIAGTPDQCTQCGECENACPQKLPIRRLLKEATIHFGAR